VHEYEKERVAAGVRDVAQLRVPFAEVFERFTERARQVVVLAREEACIFKHNYIGTEHILLGVLREEEGLGARVLRSLDITVERTRAQVVQIVGLGKESSPDQLPFTPRAKKVLDLGMREADALDDGQIATHHLLLGLLHEGEGVANRVLLDSGAERGHLRGLVLAGLHEAPDEQPAVETGPRFVVHGHPGEGSAATPSRNLPAAVCSFCGQKRPHMFSSDTPGATGAWICGECLDLFHSTLSRQRETKSQGPGTEGR